MYKQLSTFLILLPFVTSSLFASMGGLPESVLHDFSQQASLASIVVIGEPVYYVDGYPEINDMHEDHVFYYIRVSNVLAVSSDHIDTDGYTVVPEYILISDYGGKGFDSYFRCPSVFFLKPVFSDDDDDHRLHSNRKLVSQVLSEYGGERSRVFELASGSLVFPIIGFSQYAELVPESAIRLKEVWISRLGELQDYWGLSSFSEVEEFSQKALLPFFEQIDEDWFRAKTEKLDAEDPLRKVAETLEKRRELERTTDPTRFDFRRAIRVPFVGGSVLNEQNLAEAFDEKND